MFFAARTASVKKEVISFWDITSYPCFLPENYFILPPMMSSSSFVIACWRLLLYCFVKS